MPEDFAGLGDYFAETAIMHMPETAVNEDYFFVSDKDDIGMAGKVAAMQGITITHSMNNGTDNYFRRRCFSTIQENACTQGLTNRKCTPNILKIV